MAIWLLEREDSDWDEIRAMVVRAESEHMARELANKNTSLSQSKLWHDPKVATCREIEPVGTDEVILMDVLEG